MKIVVLVKDVPDTNEERHLNPETGLADRAESDRVLDEICERALEVALRLKAERPDLEIHALMLGDEDSIPSLRKAVAMGAGAARIVTDEALLGADTALTGEVLAAAARDLAPDLVFTGNLSTDGNSGLVPALVAERLGWPLHGNVHEVSLTATGVVTEGRTDTAVRRLESDLPAVVSISERAPEPRFPNFKGVMASKKAPIESVSLADLGVDAEADVPRTILVAVDRRPARESGTVITDDGTGAAALAAFLAENKLIQEAVS